MRNTRTLAIQQMTAQKTRTLAEKMAEIALRYSLDIETCAEKINLQEFGISKGHCIDKRLIEKLLGCELSGQKDKYQRESCGCLEWEHTTRVSMVANIAMQISMKQR